MTKTILLLALLSASTISAQSVQCEGITQVGYQCENRIAWDNFSTLCHLHKNTNHPVHVMTENESCMTHDCDWLWQTGASADEIHFSELSDHNECMYRARVESPPTKFPPTPMPLYVYILLWVFSLYLLLLALKDD